ncbi:MAG TPA: glycoside hydrolase family 2 TIM barrel-domain containing protein [Planctomycetota bacterium]|nr:glycoside hydrolase family 2 TIM barrel-domain containing protein [Planctomycetota bacterium]
MLTQVLSDGWTLSATGALTDVPANVQSARIPASVPGCVHTDLLAAGLIEDPYVDRNETKVQWIGRNDWRYACSFDVAESLLRHERVVLVCEGLDTIARIEVNGKAAGESADMHVPQRFDVHALLKAGKNELAITFASPLVFAQQAEARHGPLPHVEKHPFNFIRKMACNFGWDWGPALITAGIWRPIYIQAWNVARLASVRPLVLRADTRSAVVDVHVDLDRADNTAALNVSATLTGPDGQTLFQNSSIAANIARGQLKLEVPNPKLWWPRGHGAQPLYELSVSVSVPGGAELDSWKGRIGLRTVRLNTDSDSIGSQFAIEVNNRPIFCKGANWIPDDCFPHRVDSLRYRRRIDQAVAANMNMLRVWGGGIYESEDFYSICDEQGIMVWQDFLFACAAYPEEEPYSSLVAAEAKYHVARLSSHPSLVIWNGCNENIWGYFDWGWKEKIGNRTWGLGYYTKMLPSIVKQLDPTRPYWPGSPYSGSMELHPLDDRHGNKHIWDAWNQKDYSVYREYTPRFCSEFGHQAPPTYATLRHAVPAGHLAPDSPTMLHHQKAQGGNDKLHTRLNEHFEIPTNFDDWLFVTQLNQARAVQTGVEWFRSRQPVCMGALYWQLNDCWPVTSWAAVDGEGRPKPLWYATRKFFAERILTIQPEVDGKLYAYIINDTLEPWTGQLFLGKINFEWTQGPGGWKTVFIPPHSVLQVPLAYYSKLAGQKAGDEETKIHSSSELIMVQLGQHRAFWYFDIDKNLAYPEAAYETRVKAEGARYAVTVTAKSFLRDLSFFADRLDENAIVNDQLVTLLPGESFTFTFESQKQLPEKALTLPPVLQCANRFGKKA